MAGTFFISSISYADGTYYNGSNILSIKVSIDATLMGNDLIAYINRLELIAFFAGYPLIYAIVYALPGKNSAFVNKLAILLPFAYALTGTLFLGLLLKNLPPGLVKNIAGQSKIDYLQIWGLLSILFWIPAFAKKTFFSLIHSLTFFFLLLKDFFMFIISSIGREVIRNDMKIYTVSLLLNISTLAVVVITYYILSTIRGNKNTPDN